MVLLGDVTGKGVDAAAMTALVRHTAKTAARFESSPAAILGVVDEMLREEHPFSLVTLVCARLREGSGGALVELASGGHPLPLLVDRDGAVRAVGHANLVLGAMGGGDWRDERLTLAAGETLLFYTDGATDAPGDGGRFGEERLERVASGDGDPVVLVERIDRAIERFQGSREGDDRALLAIRYEGSAVGARRARVGVRGRYVRAAMISRTELRSCSGLLAFGVQPSTASRAASFSSCGGGMFDISRIAVAGQRSRIVATRSAGSGTSGSRRSSSRMSARHSASASSASLPPLDVDTTSMSPSSSST